MSEKPGFLASGLSLTPDDKDHTSTLHQEIIEIIEHLESGQGEPWLSKARVIAEQREDLHAAGLACDALALYYAALLKGSSCSTPDFDRASYYAQAMQGCGPEYQVRYHGVYGAILSDGLEYSSRSGLDDSAVPKFEQASEHLYAALKAGDASTIEYVIDVYVPLCELTEYSECWGLLYAAYLARSRCPSYTALVREESAVEATNLLKKVPNAEWVSWHMILGAPLRRYPAQCALVRDMDPPPEDAKILQKIQNDMSADKTINILKKLAPFAFLAAGVFSFMAGATAESAIGVLIGLACGALALYSWVVGFNF